MNRIDLRADGMHAGATWTPNRRDFIAALGLASGALSLGLPMAAQAAVGSSTLEGQVMALVKRLRTDGVIYPDEQTSWSVYDLSSGRKLVSINEEIPRQAASMMKPFVALAYFYTVEQGRAGYTPAIHSTMEQMIRRSNNDATNELMQLVSQYNGGGGPQSVQAVLKQNAPAIFQQTSIVEYIPSGGRTYRNKASARDYTRFLFALWHNRLPYSSELRSLMALPNNDRIVRKVPGMSSNVRVYDKTGSTAQLCGNMGIIECADHAGRRHPYIFVGIIQKDTATDYYGTWITNRSNAIREVSGLVYGYMRNQHRLA